MASDFSKVNILSTFILLGAGKNPEVKSSWSIRTEHSSSFMFDVMPHEMKSLEFLLYCVLDRTRTGLCLLVVKSVKGKGIKTISPCSNLVPDFIFLVLPQFVSYPLRMSQ